MEKNLIKLGLNPSRQQQTNADLESLPIEKFSLYRDIFDRSKSDAGSVSRSPDGVFHFGDGKIDRFLSGEWKRRLEAGRAEVAAARKALPPPIAERGCGWLSGIESATCIAEREAREAHAPALSLRLWKVGPERPTHQHFRQVRCK